MGTTTSTQSEPLMKNQNSEGTSTTGSKLETDLSMTAEERMRLEQIQNVPKYSRPETFDEKLYRKVSACLLSYTEKAYCFHRLSQNKQFSKEPLIPIGCMTTAYFLGSGIRSFYNRNASRSQKMMRARVGAQFATIVIFIGYAGREAFNVDVMPGYHPKEEEKKS